MPSLGFFLKPLLVAVLSLGGLHTVLKRHQLAIDRFVMSIVRDVGRYKARKRRMAHSSQGLMAYLAHNDPLSEIADAEDEVNLQDLVTYTESELAEFGDGRDGRPILLAVFGRIYDVSSGIKFYGPNGPYSGFGGRDVTYALATGCKTCVDLPADDLTDKELLEAQRWLAFFHWHDKYPLVGRLEQDYLAELLTKYNLESDEDIQPNEDGTAPIM